MSKKTCFVIAPIGEVNSATRKHSDLLLKQILTPIVLDCGYEAPVRADKIDAPGVITRQVIEHIVKDDLVIADLSERNANVFYELAIRHAIKKPLIQMIAKGEQIPFDVGMMRTIHFDIQDLDSVVQTKEELANQIRHLDEHPHDVESPLSQTLDIQVLKGSERPEDRALGELLAEIAQIKSIVLDLKFRSISSSLFSAGSVSAFPSVLSPELAGYHTIVADPSEFPPPAPSVKAAPIYAPSGKTDVPRKPAK